MKRQEIKCAFFGDADLSSFFRIYKPRFGLQSSLKVYMHACIIYDFCVINLLIGSDKLYVESLLMFGKQLGDIFHMFVVEN